MSCQYQGGYNSIVVPELLNVAKLDLELRALDWFYLTWLPSSGYAPAHQPMFEAWNGRPFAHGLEHFDSSFAPSLRS